MINYYVEYENFTCVIKIVSDIQNIDFNSDDFKIEVLDLLEYCQANKTKEERDADLKWYTSPTSSFSNHETLYEPLTCYKCNGTGKSYNLCTFCNGTGKLFGNLSDNTDDDCPECSGLGYFHDICPKCLGNGKYNILDVDGNIKTINCEFCGGVNSDEEKTGKGYVDACTNCKGTGIILNKCPDGTSVCATKNVYSSNIDKYCNSDKLSLIKNGIQFYSSEDNSTLFIKCVAKGKSDLSKCEDCNGLGKIYKSVIYSSAKEYTGFLIYNSENNTFNLTQDPTQATLFDTNDEAKSILYKQIDSLYPNSACENKNFDIISVYNFLSNPTYYDTFKDCYNKCTICDGDGLNYVGINTAIFTVSLDKDHVINFQVNLMPRMFTGDVYQVPAEETGDECPFCNEIECEYLSPLQKLTIGAVTCNTCHGSGKYLKKCPTCEGLGILPGSICDNNCGCGDNIGQHPCGICTNCNGKGTVKIGGTTVSCPKCTGKNLDIEAGWKRQECVCDNGYEYLKTCTRCNGTGKIGTGKTAKTCTKCIGLGKLGYCNYCNGTGKIKILNDNGEVVRTVECYHCNKTGRTICDICNGDGKIPYCGNSYHLGYIETSCYNCCPDHHKQVCSYCGGSHKLTDDPQLPPGVSRVDYNWNDDAEGQDNLYVNNATNTFTAAYRMDMKTGKVTCVNSGLNQFKTPLYAVKTSAYVSDYLKNGYFIPSKELDPEQTPVMRGFDFDTTSSMSSILYDSYNGTFVDIKISENTELFQNYYYITSSDKQGNIVGIHDNVYMKEIKQNISADTNRVARNQLMLRFNL